jgi:hypothetical protein
MHSRRSRLGAIRATSIAFMMLLEAGAPLLRAAPPESSRTTAAEQSGARWGKLSVRFPTSTLVFHGDGAVIANANCLLCHSADFVLLQPKRTQAQWEVTINKMRSAYGAWIPAAQVAELAAYLSRLPPAS